jgi:hypothetical protein
MKTELLELPRGAVKASMVHSTGVTEARAFHYGLIQVRHGSYWQAWSTFYGRIDGMGGTTCTDYDDSRRYLARLVRRYRREVRCKLR